ncbi:GNAT family N-acetyltransferase [Psychrobacter sp. AOP7-B1-25]|uniref:GNAT family N-acetyltransferase n=1 Tax=Psychrobacter sp. AOP7-B1-25 TaxID=3457644 RepID=UPI00402B89BB
MSDDNIKSSNMNVDYFDKESVFLREATLDDIGALEQLLNCCYREIAGWTNEADLIGGIRTTSAELAAVINDPNHYYFVYPKTTTGDRDGEEIGEIFGCIAVDIKTDANSNKKAYIGMFAVHPALQGKGVGNVILQAAETFANRHLQSLNQPSRLTMSILSHRPELLAYYQRRGYQLNGNKMPFPNDGNNGEPKRDDLELLELEKIVS